MTVNGLSLCKICHAACDENLISIRVDHVVDVGSNVGAQIDGPMLFHDLREMA